MKNFSLLPEGKVEAELKQQHIKSWVFHNGKALLHIRGHAPQGNDSLDAQQEQRGSMDTFNPLQQGALHLFSNHSSGIPERETTGSSAYLEFVSEAPKPVGHAWNSDIHRKTV